MVFRMLAKRSAALVALLVIFAAVFTEATTFLGLFTTTEGAAGQYQLYASTLAGKCPGGVLSYVVANANGNTASFPDAHAAVLQFQAANTGMTSGRRQTSVDVTVLCNGITTVCNDGQVIFKVLPSTSTSTTTTTTTTVAPVTMTCVSPSPITVANYVTQVIQASAFTTTCSTPSLALQTQTGPSGAATTAFAVLGIGSSYSLYFNEDGNNLAVGSYVATVKVSCGAASCTTSQTIVVGTPASNTTTTTTTTAPGKACPGDYEYSLMLNADGTFTAQTVSLADRAIASGAFCTSGGKITSQVSAAHNGVVTSNGAAATFAYTPNTVAAADAMDSFAFSLSCAGEATTCQGTAVITIVGPDNGEVYYAMNGAIACRGTCNAGAWRTSPYALTSFDVNTTGVAETPRKDGRAVNAIDFDFTVDGELLIHAYTTIGNLAARFVTFYPITSAQAAGILNSSSVPDGSHMSFEPTCLNEQATTGVASSIWTWTNNATLIGHLNTQTDAYKSGDNYYQKFGGNHRQCDVYRTNPCKYAPFMTPTLHDNTNNPESNQIPSVQWNLYVNDCDATWVGKATVESLRALRQPDGSSTFTLDSTGTYLMGKVYSQSVKPANWTSPSAGIVHKETPYAMRVKIHNTIVVDAQAQPIASSVVPAATQLDISSDIQYSPGVAQSTHERLYAYSLLLYPYFAANDSAVNITASKISVTSVTLLNETWTSPNHLSCPTCIGTMLSCNGTGVGFNTNCGSKAFISFEAIDYNTSTFEDWDATNSTSDAFASTTIGTKNALRVSFAARVNGRDSVNSSGAYPVGTFAVAVKLSNKQVFHVVVNQTDYITEINTRFVDTEVCRASAYWPVPDPLGTSVPVAPYSAASLAFPNNSTTTSKKEEEEREEEEEAYHGAPERLTPLETCNTMPSFGRTNVNLTSMTATVNDGGEQKQVSMCVVQDERTFGVTDWVVISLPSIQEELAKVTAENVPNIIADSSLANDNAFTVAQLQYLVLSVAAAQVAPNPLTQAPADGHLHYLLDGTSIPSPRRTELATWMYPGGGGDSSSSEPTEDYLPWEIYASSLNYRRINLQTNASAPKAEPFNFAFIPGSLLRSTSNIRVSMTVRASIKFTTYAHTAANATHASQLVTTAEREEALLYILPLSRAISSALRFDSDSYDPVTMKSGIGQKSATAILIVLFVAIVAVLAASAYIEITYKRKIHNAKYHPKRPESAVGIRYGRDGKPKENQKTAKEGSRAEAAVLSAGSKSRAGGAASGGVDGTEMTVKTKFGTVRGEQLRVGESVDGSSRESSEAGDSEKAGDGKITIVNPPIGEEQPRAADDEVAQF